LHTGLHERFGYYGKQSQSKGRQYPGAWRKGELKSDRGSLLGHIDTPKLNSPRINFTRFPFQHSSLSNTSTKLILPRPIACC